MFTFPQLKNRNIFLFYVLSMFNNAWFLIGNWIFFWLRFMTYGQLGWIDAAAFAFGMLMEIPTGAISDLVGKKKTLILAMALASIGFFIVAAANTKYHILFGFLIVQAGWAFYSGAAEALAYDTLKEHKNERDFDAVISLSNILGIIATTLCGLFGIALYQWNFRAPHYAMAVSYGITFLLTWFLTEPKIDTEKFSLKNYFAQLGQGAHQLMHPSLKRFMPLIFSLLGIYYMFSFGFIKPAMAEYFGFFASEQGFIFAVLSLFSAVLVHFIPMMRKKFNDTQGLVLLTTLLGFGFILACVITGWIGALVLTLIVAAGSLAQPWVSVVVNRELDSKYRATTLSTISMVTKVPYILAAVVAGKLIQDGYIVQFNLAVGVFTLGVVGISVFFLRKDLK